MPRLPRALTGFILYGAGVLMLLCHLLLGWLGMLRIGRTAIPVAFGGSRPAAGLGAIPAYESTQVAAPLTAGLFSRRSSCRQPGGIGLVKSSLRSWPTNMPM